MIRRIKADEAAFKLALKPMPIIKLPSSLRTLIDEPDLG